VNTPAWIAGAVLAWLVAALVTYLVLRLRFERWKREFEKGIRRDSTQKSKSSTMGQAYEKLVPLLPAFRWDPRDAHFLGHPIDYIVFDGLNDEERDEVRAVVFVEVKTGASQVSRRQRLVREAIGQRRVEWCELRVPVAPEAPGS